MAYLTSFIIRSRELGREPSLPVFKCCFQMVAEPFEHGYFMFRPRPGYHVRVMPQSYDVWKRKFILVNSDDWDKFQPPRIPTFLSPTPHIWPSSGEK
ncbi:hypothetical protein Dimus_038332 [Dionaea muscipula]